MVKNIQDDKIVAFKNYARGMLDEYTSDLKAKYATDPFSTKDVRLKLFNEYMDTLKNKLQYQLNEILNEEREKNSSGYDDTKQVLTGIYKDCINDFFKRDFQ